MVCYAKKPTGCNPRAGRPIVLSAGRRRYAMWVLKWLTRSRRPVARSPSCSLLEAISSLPAADCSVTWAMPWMAFETSRAPAACSAVAAGDLGDLHGRGLDAVDDLAQRLRRSLRSGWRLRPRAGSIP